MKSTIKIGLGAGNEPAIQMKVVPSDDLRDQVCCQFLHGLEGVSNLCHVDISGTNVTGSDTYVTHFLEIKPLPPYSHYMLHQRIEEIFHAIVRPTPDVDKGVEMVTGGGTIGFYKNKGAGPGIELNRDDLRTLNIVQLVKVVSDNLQSIIDDNG